MLGFAISVKGLKTGRSACFESGKSRKFQYLWLGELDELDI